MSTHKERAEDALLSITTRYGSDLSVSTLVDIAKVHATLELADAVRSAGSATYTISNFTKE